ncbi:MbeD/MobD family mobilization/exclusion protein [Mixta mediterraneensis]|uniref:MbeD/MobD family mobilization/exclusion protein n=1 Tax=Mixta mediterraneensis TaxID=2758443 RepID=UPI0030B907D7
MHPAQRSSSPSSFHWAMFETTSQALTHSDRVCQHLSSQVESLRAQVESLSRNVSRLMR